MPVGGIVNATIIEPVQILYRGHNKALYTLASASRTVAVTPNGGLNGTYGNLPTNRPLGVLSGMIAAPATVSGSQFGAQVCSDTTSPIGVFLLNYEGNSFESITAVATDKVSIISSPAIIKVFVFETRNFANNANLTYVIGGNLYSSPNGLFTNETGGGAGGTVVAGVLNHVPTTAENWLGVELRV